MNNVYNPREIYSIRGDLCYDNKVMVNEAPSARQGQQATAITITDRGEVKQNAAAKPRMRCRIPRLRIQQIVNTLIILIVGPLLYLLEYGYIPGHKQGFTCRDPLYSHRYTGDTITITILFVGTVLVPLLVIGLVEYLTHNTLRLRDFWFFYKECLIGSCFVLLITEIAKIIVGEHRPHFFDVCKPNENKDCQSGDFVETYTCSTSTYSNYFLVDSSRSFPSGHSSVSVFAALFSAYIVQTRLPTQKTGRLLKPFLVSVCLTWGLLCSLTRITDRRHHWWDVLAGMALGAMGAAYTAYFLHKKLYGSDGRTDVQPKISTSTTTLLDVKNKDATSVII